MNTSQSARVSTVVAALMSGIGCAGNDTASGPQSTVGGGVRNTAGGSGATGGGYRRRRERKRREASPFPVCRDEAERVADFHALQHSFISNLVSGRWPG